MAPPLVPSKLRQMGTNAAARISEQVQCGVFCDDSRPGQRLSELLAAQQTEAEKLKLFFRTPASGGAQHNQGEAAN